MDELLDQLRQAEESLQNADVRRDAARVGSLLHEDFLEYGRSGAVYDRTAILDLFASESLPGRVASQDYSLTRLGDNAALLTYKSAIIDDSKEARRHSMRASVWVQAADGWKLRFHQGTPTDAFPVTGR